MLFAIVHTKLKNIFPYLLDKLLVQIFFSNTKDFQKTRLPKKNLSTYFSGDEVARKLIKENAIIISARRGSIDVFGNLTSLLFRFSNS